MHVPSRGLAVLAAGLTWMSVSTAAAGSEEVATVGFEPGYASGNDYDAFTATLPGYGLLYDGDGDGNINDERCDSDGEAALTTVRSAFATLVAAGTACRALVENLDIPCFAALAVGANVLNADAIVLTQCDYQDAAVDGAEIEAAYENSRIAAAMEIEQQLTTCAPVMSLRWPASQGGRAEEVRDLVDLRISQTNSTGRYPNAVAAAEGFYNAGVSQFGAGQYRQAYHDWCQAYRKLAEATN